MNEFKKAIQLDIWNNISKFYSKDLIVSQIFDNKTLLGYKDSLGNVWNIRDYDIDNPFTKYMFEVGYDSEWGRIGHMYYNALNDIFWVTSYRKLRARWTPELSDDLECYCGFDAELELTAMLTEQLRMEVDNEILNLIWE